VPRRDDTFRRNVARSHHNYKEAPFAEPASVSPGKIIGAPPESIRLNSRLPRDPGLGAPSVVSDAPNTCQTGGILCPLTLAEFLGGVAAGD
jgi:hypothetical protein